MSFLFSDIWIYTFVNVGVNIHQVMKLDRGIYQFGITDRAAKKTTSTTKKKHSVCCRRGVHSICGNTPMQLLSFAPEIGVLVHSETICLFLLPYGRFVRKRRRTAEKREEKKEGKCRYARIIKQHHP